MEIVFGQFTLLYIHAIEFNKVVNVAEIEIIVILKLCFDIFYRLGRTFIDLVCIFNMLPL